MKARTAPQIKLAPVPKGYGRLLVHEFDWWQESLNVSIPGTLWQRLKDAKERAVELDDRRATPIAFQLDDIPFQLQPRGAAGGKEFVLVNEHYRIEIGSPNREWSMSWRATSAAIWAEGVEKLRNKIYTILKFEGCRPNDPDDYIRLSRVDYCFDIESPAFTREMVPNIAEQTVCPKETKVRGDWVVQRDMVETLTIGLGATCQVQIYEKTKEITEASNKTWLYDIWGFDPETGECEERLDWSDVWRVEIRLRKTWLKDRKVNTPDAFLASMWECLSDALYNRRLCKRTTDSNRRRWPLHPIYTIALETIGNPTRFKSIDRTATGRADVLEKIMLQNIAGTTRSLAMLRLREAGVFEESEAEDILQTAMKLLLEDQLHPEKIRRATEKYALVDNPV